MGIRTIQVNLSSNIINFGIGQPGFDLLPQAIMRRAAATRLSQDDPSLLAYGYERGDGYFRLALASFLEKHYELSVSAEQLMVTCGASQALDLVCTLTTQPGDLVYTAEPTYFLALRIFADHGLRVRGLPTDQDGLIMEELEGALKKERPKLLYTVPTFQNPAGCTLSLERRERLAELSAEYDFLVAADEVYHLLYYQEPPPPPMAQWIDNEHIISIGSFSKILAPGLRLGWVQAGLPLLDRLAGSGLLDSGGGLNPFTSNLVRVAIEEGWQEDHLTFLKETYRRRITIMAEALKENMPDPVQFTIPTGGFFFWLTLPDGVDTGTLLQEANAKGVGFTPGIRFSTRQGQTNKMRLSFAFYQEEQIHRGVERLGDLLRESK